QSLTKQTLLALDADTGRTLWEHDYAWPYQPGGMFPGPRATPTYANDRIYFAAPDGQVACVDAVDGHPIWSLNVLKQFDGRGVDEHAATPLYRAPHLRVMQAYRAGSDLYELKSAQQTSSLSQGRQQTPLRADASSPVGEGGGEGSSGSPPKPTSTAPDDLPLIRAEKLRHDTTMSNDIASSVLVDGFVYGF